MPTIIKNMILTAKIFNEKFSSLDASLQNAFNDFCNNLESAKESEILDTLSKGESLNVLTVLDFQGIKIYYSLSRNEQNHLNINFLDISRT